MNPIVLAVAKLVDLDLQSRGMKCADISITRKIIAKVCSELGLLDHNETEILSVLASVQTGECPEPEVEDDCDCDQCGDCGEKECECECSIEDEDDEAIENIRCILTDITYNKNVNEVYYLITELDELATEYNKLVDCDSTAIEEKDIQQMKIVAGIFKQKYENLNSEYATFLKRIEDKANGEWDFDLD